MDDRVVVTMDVGGWVDLDCRCINDIQVKTIIEVENWHVQTLSVLVIVSSTHLFVTLYYAWLHLVCLFFEDHLTWD